MMTLQLSLRIIAVIVATAALSFFAASVLLLPAGDSRRRTITLWAPAPTFLVVALILISDHV